MNPDSNNDGLVYKAAGFAIFIVLVALIILITLSSDSNSVDTKLPDDTTPLVTDAEPPVTTADSGSSDTTADTTAAETTADTTQAASTPATPTEFTPVKPPESFSTDTIKKYLDAHKDVVLAETEDAGPDYIKRIVFLGDSTTNGLRAYKMLEDGRDTKQVWTPVNGTLTLSQANTALIKYPETGKEITIKEAVAAKKPDILVITLGVNGVSFMKEEYFKTEYNKLITSIKEASPDTKIILHSIYPVARSYELLQSINNEKIDAANEWICELAKSAEVKYLDTNSVLRDKDGWLPEEYHNGDGIHLKENSFTIVLNNIRTHAYPES